MANEYLTRKPTSTGNRKVFTFSGWVKRAGVDEHNCIFTTNPGGTINTVFNLKIHSNNTVMLEDYDDGYRLYYATDGVFRDSGSWMHVALSINTTLDDPQKRARIFLNGTEPKLDYSTEVAFNQELLVNSPTYFHEIGKRLYNGSSGQHWDGEMADLFFVDGQALTPDVFGFYKEGKGYISAGSTQTTDFRPGQWVPKTPRVIKSEINRRGGFGVNGFYLPMNDSSNFGADFHTTPDTIITLKGEDLPQPKNGAPTTTDAYVSQLRTDPYAANLVLAVPGITGALGAAHTDFSANIKGSGTNKVVTANGNAGVAVTASYYGSALSFDGTGDYLSIPDNSDFGFGSGDFTIEYWINHNAATSSAHTFDLRSSGDEDSVTGFYAGVGATNFTVYLDGADRISVTGELQQNQWTHHAIERVGSTLTFYQNGVAAGFSTVSGGTLRSSAPAIVGAKRDATASLNGYMQDFRVYKGVAKYKGGFDVPKPYTPVGISTWRAIPDCTANNFATLNSVDSGINGTGTLSNGNLTFASDNNEAGRRATIGFPTTGEYYWETRISSATDGWPNVGILKNSQRVGTYITDGTTQIRPYAAQSFKPYLIFDKTDVIAKVSDTALTGGDIIQCAWSSDGTDGKLWFGINDQWYGYNGSNVVTLTKAQVAAGNTAIRTVGVVTESWSPVVYFQRSEEHTINFGQNPTFSGNTTAGTYADGNGKGLFKYEPPTDFLALCEDNLPTPAIADPGKYFKTVLYEGDGNEGRSIVGVGFTPDLVWIKTRTSTNNHYLVDSVRGLAGGGLLPSSTSVENGNQTLITNLDSDGFTVGHTYNGGSNGAANGVGAEVVAWCWKAGAGTTSTNTDGSINSVVSVNQDAGFSIVSYTGDLSATGTSTIGHGLGKPIDFVMVKSRNTSHNWNVMSSALSDWNQNIYLNSADAATDGSGNGSRSAPTSTVFSVNYDSGQGVNGTKYIAYCWTEIEGFSKFGYYIGDDRDDDGVFVYCGFKPAMVIIKNATTSSLNWHIIDSSRSSTNPAAAKLYPNTTGVENTTTTDNAVDFLSNGFKLRGDVTLNNATNGNGDTMIFAAFAESPFTTANAK